MKIILYNKMRNLPLAENFFTIDVTTLPVFPGPKFISLIKDPFSF